jgi:hypothetical protein
MWKSVSKKERGCAQVWWEVTTTGRLDTRLTTPVRSRAFFMRVSRAMECKMVALATPRLDFVPTVNLSRMFLFRAADALAAGRLFEAGCLLRESVRRQCFAECAWKGCLPPKQAQQRSPMALLHALKEAGHVGYVGLESTRDIIEICNKCAHCVPVDPREVQYSICVWHKSIDNDPCGEPTERTAHMKPQKDGYDCDDCDDDDGANWWKGGAV